MSSFETFSYTPIELAESMTSTVQDTLVYLYNNDYLTKEEFDELASTLAVYALPNRKGFSKRLRERFFGDTTKENSYVFPIVEIDPVHHYNNNAKTKKPELNVIQGDFNKDSE